MREEEGARYLSPLVKQDLAKLDTDGDTRRLALKSLKLFVEQLDASTLPRFISQIADSREPGATRSYAIALFEEVVRVHGKLVVPHIPKVMNTLVRCSSASGSFPQLQVACARVTAALARHGIDAATPQDEAEEIVREICAPLVDALSGKLEPVAANAAACLHALAETEKWKYAREEIVHDVCQRTTVALSEKPTRTAAHMQLIRILASANPDVLSLHGANLLRAGEEILKSTANPWQLRKAAAQLLQAVLTILDKETLETELNPALQALDSCRLDRMPHVRAAVSEALHTAKMFATLNSGTTTTHTLLGVAASPVRKTTPTDGSRSPWRHNDHAPVSPVPKRGTSPRAVSRSPRAASPTSQESRRLSFASASISISESVQATRSSAARSIIKGGASRAKRAPLYPARGMGGVHSPRSSGTPGTSPSSSTTTFEECESPSRRLNLKEYNVQLRSTNGHVYEGEDDLLAGHHGDSSLRPRAPLTSDALFTPLLPAQLDAFGVEVQKLKSKAQSDSNAPLADLTRDHSTTIKKSPGVILPQGEDSGLAQFVAGFEHARQGRANSDSTIGHVDVVLPRLKLAGGIHSLDNSSSGGRTTPMLKASSISLQTGFANDFEVATSEDASAVTADVEVEKHEVFTVPDTPVRAAARSDLGGNSWKLSKGGDVESAHGSPHGSQLSSSLRHYYKPLAHLSNANSELEEKTTSTQTKGFLPFVTPKRLVRSLSNLSVPESRGSATLEQDMMKLAHDELLSPSGVLTFNPAEAERDAEAASEMGWSVRDNPIASEESYRADSSSDEETSDGRCRDRAYGSSPRLLPTADSCSPRDIRMISPSKSLSRSINADPATWRSINRGAHPDDDASISVDHADRAEPDHPCPSCVLAEQTFNSCRLRNPATDVDAKDKPPSGLSNLLHEDEMNGHELCEINKCSDLADSDPIKCSEADSDPTKCSDEAESDPSSPPSSPKKLERRNDRCQVWKKLCWFAETALGGSLCVVIALPLAMMVAKALHGSRAECHLVPT